MAKLQDLARLVEGHVVGDGSVEVCRVAPIDTARSGDLTFLSNPKYRSQLTVTEATAVIVPPGIEVDGKTTLVCANPYLAFAKILTHLQGPQFPESGVSSQAHVADSVCCGDSVSIHPGCVVGENVIIGDGTVLLPGVVIYDNVRIGKDCILHANAVVREGSRLGDRVILQPSAVIGSDGFGFAPDGSSYYKIPQVGIVVLEDDVEIGSCACIDRAALGETRIARGTKLDNMVHIAHNVQIGEDTVITAQVGIAGSSKVGNHCTFGGQSAVAGHVTMGDNITIGGKGGVTNNLKTEDAPQVLSGFPAINHREWLKAAMTFGHLPEMRKKINQLEKTLAQLQLEIEEK